MKYNHYYFDWTENELRNAMPAIKAGHSSTATATV